jgi:trehalose 6-phosphate phosphatase
VLLDFDGTLSPIVERPESAAPAPGAREATAAVAAVYGLVAVVSGRRGEELRRLLGVEGVRYVGLYGLGEEPRTVPDAVLAAARSAAEAVPGSRVEEKEVSVAVHYRQAADPQGARTALLRRLSPSAADAGLEAIEGKMVIELVPSDRPRKGGAVRALLGETGARAALYAGDDRADLEAFEELDRFRAVGGHAVRVAVAGPETPEALIAAADLTVAGPEGMVALLRGLADAAES